MTFYNKNGATPATQNSIHEELDIEVILDSGQRQASWSSLIEVEISDEFHLNQLEIKQQQLGPSINIQTCGFYREMVCIWLPYIPDFISSSYQTKRIDRKGPHTRILNIVQQNRNWLRAHMLMKIYCIVIQ